MRRNGLIALMALTVGATLLALALLVGGAAGGNGHGKGKHPGSTAEGQTGYHFVVLSTMTGTPDRVIIQGDGSFNGNRAHGGGSFDHFRAGGSAPLPVVASGTWKANDVVSFTSGTSHGVFQGGELVMHATFYPKGGAPITGVTLDVVCNLGPAGFSIPGKEEGVYVTVPGSPPLSFVPAGLGVTIFTTSNH